MRVVKTLIFCATLPIVAGFAFGAGAQMVPQPPNSMVAVQPPSDMTRLAQMDQQIRELTNQLEQRDFQLRQLQQNFDKFVNDTNMRFQSLEAGGAPNAQPAPQPTPMQNIPSSAGAPDGIGAIEGSLDDANAPYNPKATPPLGQITEKNSNNDGALTSGTPQGAQASPAQAYDQAFSYLQQSNYSDAQRAFSDFLKTYPTHTLAANAQYWLGETYFAQTQYSSAAKIFAKAFQEHPQGQKAPDALFKLALTLDKMNKKDDACVTLGELFKRFPSGPASVLRRGNEEGQRMGCKL